MFVITLVQMVACEIKITCIAQVTFNFVNSALLIYNWRLSSLQCEILFNLVADKDRLYDLMNLRVGHVQYHPRPGPC